MVSLSDETFEVLVTSQGRFVTSYITAYCVLRLGIEVDRSKKLSHDATCFALVFVMLHCTGCIGWELANQSTLVLFTTPERTSISLHQYIRNGGSY